MASDKKWWCWNCKKWITPVGFSGYGAYDGCPTCNEDQITHVPKEAIEQLQSEAYEKGYKEASEFNGELIEQDKIKAVAETRAEILSKLDKLLDKYPPSDRDGYDFTDKVETLLKSQTPQREVKG